MGTNIKNAIIGEYCSIGRSENISGGVHLISIVSMSNFLGGRALFRVNNISVHAVGTKSVESYSIVERVHTREIRKCFLLILHKNGRHCMVD